MSMFIQRQILKAKYEDKYPSNYALMDKIKLTILQENNL